MGGGGGWGILKLHDSFLVHDPISHAGILFRRNFLHEYFSLGKTFGRSMQELFSGLLAAHDFLGGNFPLHEMYLYFARPPE